VSALNRIRQFGDCLGICRAHQTHPADWACDLINPGTWATVSSFITLGLTWWESCLAVFVGGWLAALIITSNGIIGAKIHTPFAVSSRSVFGYWGCKFVVFSRLVIACFWLSINSWTGGVFVGLSKLFFIYYQPPY
jgi:NCS1 family nucleobase:cation symporter-1